MLQVHVHMWSSGCDTMKLVDKHQGFRGIYCLHVNFS